MREKYEMVFIVSRKGVECRKTGNQFKIKYPRQDQDIIVCVQFKTYCHSAACKNTRDALYPNHAPLPIANEIPSMPSVKPPKPERLIFSKDVCDCQCHQSYNFRRTCCERAEEHEKPKSTTETEDNKQDEYLKGIMERDDEV